MALRKVDKVRLLQILEMLDHVQNLVSMNVGYEIITYDEKSKRAMQLYLDLNVRSRVTDILEGQPARKFEKPFVKGMK